MDRAELAAIVREVFRETFTSLSSIVDVEARHGVSAALQKIESHERICAERDRNAAVQRTRLEEKIDDLSKKLDTKVSGLYKMAWGTTIWAALALLAIVIFFIKRELFPG